MSDDDPYGLSYQASRNARKDQLIIAADNNQLLKQIRKALNDIQAAYTDNKPTKAEYQVHLLRKMVDEHPSRRQPWSFYQQQVMEEFDE